MGFKKNNIKKPSPLIPNLIGFISLSIIFSLGILLIKNTDFFNFKFDPKNEISNNENQNIDSENLEDDNLEVSNKDNINILLVGRGGGNHDAPDLTDTIILATINSKTKIISMLSIPRDLYVEYPTIGKKGKINGLYAKYKIGGKSEEIGINVLKDKITEITGQSIDYYINIDFNGFKEIVDTIGGIEITIPEDFVDNQYPDGNWGYTVLTFKKGTWIFDGENALKYSRSRHSTSDFDRSIRQQQIITAIKDKLTGSFFLTSPGKIKELYGVFVKNVHTDLKLSTIIKLAYNLNSKGDFNVISSNLNDSCYYGSNTCSKGGFLYTPSRDLFGGLSVLLVDGLNITKLNDFSELQKYTNIVFNYPEVLKDQVKINIFNSLKRSNLAGELSNNVVKYGFNIPDSKSIGNTSEIYDKSIIYYNNIDENSVTLKVLRLFFKGDFIELELPKYSKDNANIEIIIGSDYLLKETPFKF